MANAPVSQGQASNFPGGFPAGLGLLGLNLVFPKANSQIFYVNNSTGAKPQNFMQGVDQNRGTYLRPMATLAKALSVCLPGNGDIVVLGPAHAETVSTATALAVNTSGVTVVGVGTGESRPSLTFDTLIGATATITGANVGFQNIIFKANFANITTLFTLSNASGTGVFAGTTLTITAPTGTFNVGNMVVGVGVANNTFITAQVSGTTGGAGVYTTSLSQTVASVAINTAPRGFVLQNCEVRDTSSALNFLNLVATGTTDNACDALVLQGNKIFLLATSGVVNLLALNSTTDRVQITDNYYQARTTNAGAVLVYASGKFTTNFLMTNNIFNLVNAVGTATGYLITSNTSTSTGYIHGNYDFCLANTTYASSLQVTAGTGLRFGQNWHARTADKSPGTVLPAADS